MLFPIGADRPIARAATIGVTRHDDVAREHERWAMRTEAALARHGQAELTLDAIEIDEPGPGEILVEMVAVGLCHTDEAMRHTWPEQRTPMVFGHEGAGRVLRVGEGVDHLVPGDRVVQSFPSCGR